jgi:hypothetical protein
LSTCQNNYQAKLLDIRLRPTLGDLNKMLDRMYTVAFLPEDKYLRLVAGACDAMHGLCVELYYQSCRHGVGTQG